MKKMIIASAFAALALPVFAAPAADAPPADCNGIAVAIGEGFYKHTPPKKD